MTPFRFSPRPNRAAEIHWREWGPEAFREAADRDRPILLGISAVWCHWCHVMDETSYSDDEVIRLANERFVPIRVDRDARPDVDRRYNMGGWPTTAFLSPDGEILHGGTYVPPDAMRQSLAQVADLWKERRAELVARIAEARAEQGAASAPRARALTWDIVDAVRSLVRGEYDAEYGGFGREPKFPQTSLLRLLMDEVRRAPHPDVDAMLHRTLGAMAGGGMYDRVEGGFFRYATTRQWQVPHFEKMLEDNAGLLRVYADAHRLYPEAGYGRVARDVIRWMDATLWRDDAKAFAGSQDADEHYYSLTSPELRAGHAGPFVDPTIYAGWNALAASAYYAAADALDDASLDARASAAMRSLQERMWSGGSLMHFETDGVTSLPDLLADLTAWTAALLDGYETGRHSAALGLAADAARHLRERLEDREHGGFWDAPERDELGRVATREKPIEDGALAADTLLRLAALTGDDSWRLSAVRALEGFVAEYRRWGQFAAGYASAVARALTEPLVVTVVGRGAQATALWQVARAAIDPAISLHRIDPERPGDEHGPSDRERLQRLGFPEAVAAYVCVGTTCSAPIDQPAALERELARSKERLTRD